MKLLGFLFAVLLMLNSCQNPSRIKVEQSSEATPNPPRSAGYIFAYLHLAPLRQGFFFTDC